MADEVPDSIRRFLADCIDSVEQLSVLLLLFERRDKRWTVSTITQELRSTEGSITKRLDALYACHLLRKTPEDPGKQTLWSVDPELESLVKEVSELYRRMPYRLIEIIYARPNNALRAFADAFRFNKEDKK